MHPAPKTSHTIGAFNETGYADGCQPRSRQSSRVRPRAALVIHACEGARRRRPPALLRGRRRPATRGAHGRAAACSGRADRERARHPFDRSQPLRPRCRADALHRWASNAGDARQRENLRAALLARAGDRRARPCRCLSTRPSGVRRCSSARSRTTRSSPPSFRIAARRSSITGSRVSTTKRWRGSGRNARRCATCFVMPGRSRCSDRACACGPDESSCPAAPRPSRCGRRSSGPIPPGRRRSCGASSATSRATWPGSTMRSPTSTSRGCDSRRVRRCLGRRASSAYARCSTSSRATATSGSRRNSRSAGGHSIRR